MGIFKTSLPNTEYNEYMCYVFESAFQENQCFGAMNDNDNDDVIKSNTMTSVSGIMSFCTLHIFENFNLFMVTTVAAILCQIKKIYKGSARRDDHDKRDERQR